MKMMVSHVFIVTFVLIFENAYANSNGTGISYFGHFRNTSHTLYLSSKCLISYQKPKQDVSCSTALIKSSHILSNIIVNVIQVLEGTCEVFSSSYWTQTKGMSSMGGQGGPSDKYTLPTDKTVYNMSSPTVSVTINGGDFTGYLLGASIRTFPSCTRSTRCDENTCSHRNTNTVTDGTALYGEQALVRR